MKILDSETSICNFLHALQLSKYGYSDISLSLLIVIYDYKKRTFDKAKKQVIIEEIICDPLSEDVKVMFHSNNNVGILVIF